MAPPGENGLVPAPARPHYPPHLIHLRGVGQMNITPALVERVCSKGQHHRNFQTVNESPKHLKPSGKTKSLSWEGLGQEGQGPLSLARRGPRGACAWELPVTREQ